MSSRILFSDSYSKYCKSSLAVLWISHKGLLTYLTLNNIFHLDLSILRDVLPPQRRIPVSFINLLISFLLGIVSSLVATAIYIRAGRRKRNRPLNNLLNFGGDEIIFVFTHGGNMPQSILPKISTEAFIAVNNITSCLIQTGWKGPIRVRDTNHINDADKRKNLVILTGPKSNSFTGEVLDKVKGQVQGLFEFQKISDDPEQWQVVTDIYKCQSPSYEQEELAKQTRVEIATQKVEDIAIIVKVTNPWEGANKIVIIAGIRGIGTWGAADFLRKRVDELYRAKSGTGKFKKNGDFAALLKVTYENYNVVQVDLRQMIDIS